MVNLVRRRLRTAAACAIFVAVAGTGAPSGAAGEISAPAASIAFVAGMDMERALGPADEHVYTARLASGAAVVGEADQHGVDLVIDVFGPDGMRIAQLDSPNGTEGPEPIDFTALKAGTYKFVIHTLDKGVQPGKYVMKISQLVGPADNAKRLAKQIYPTPAIYDLWLATRTDPKAVDAFLAGLNGKSAIVEPIAGDSSEMRVTYLYKGDADTDAVVVGGGPDLSNTRMRRLPGTDLFFGTQLVPSDARFLYSFTVAELHHAGTNGEVTVPETIQTPRTLLELPNAPAQPYNAVKAGVAKGTSSSVTIKSTVLNESRDLTVYTPAGYDAAAAPNNLLIVFDGETFGGSPRATLIPTPTILDNMIAEKKIGPTVAVMVSSMGTRNRDLPGSKAFADFIAGEVVPWARSHYRVAPGPQHVVTAGSSFGGFAATYCAFTHPEAIGNVISLSGSYWVTKDWQSVRFPYPHDSGLMIEEFKRAKHLPIRFYLEIGRFEAGATMLGSNRDLRDVLLLKGYDVDYHELNGAHQYVQWRGALADGLISLLGTRQAN
jgi:enterochelin esterase family protein